MSDDKVNYGGSVWNTISFILVSFILAGVMFAPSSESGDSWVPFWLAFSVVLILGFAVLLYFLIWHAKVESGKMKDTWQFKFLTFGCPKRPNKINGCEVAGALGVASLSVFLVVIINLVGFLFASRVNPIMYRPNWMVQDDLMISYENWPTFYGHRVWPITLVALVFLIFVSCVLPFLHIVVTSFLLIVIFSILNKKVLKKSSQVLLGKVCISKETGVSDC